MRVIWRLDEMKPFIENDVYSNRQLDLAIMEECGSSDRTLRDIKKQLQKIGFVASYGLSLWVVDKSQSRAAFGFGNKDESVQEKLGTINTVPSAYLPPLPS